MNIHSISSYERLIAKDDYALLVDRLLLVMTAYSINPLTAQRMQIVQLIEQLLDTPEVSLERHQQRLFCLLRKLWQLN